MLQSFQRPTARKFPLKKDRFQDEARFLRSWLERPLVMGAVTILLWRWRHRFRPGTLFALWAVLAGIERFLVEFIRRNDEVLAGLTQAQLISIVMIVAGGAWIVAHKGFAPAAAPQRA